MKESRKARAYAIVFLYRVGRLPYRRAKKELNDLGMPDLGIAGTCPSIDALHAHSVEELKRIIHLHVNNDITDIECNRPLRFANAGP